MQLTTALVFVFCVSVSARSLSQTVSIKNDRISYEKIFLEIKRQTGYTVAAGAASFNRKSVISVNASKMELTGFLADILEGTPYTFDIRSHTIFIKRKVEKPTAPSFASIATNEAPPPIAVRGKVTDQQGNPLPNVSVVVPGTPFGTMTNASGEYVLQNVPDNAQLYFSFVGYTPQKLNINNRSEINITLLLDQEDLDEMVIIGYGRTTRRLNTGSVSTVNAEVIEKQPVQNVIAALPGRIAGVQITQDNGTPGGNTQVQIRGQGSLNSGTIPLYIVDGVPYTNFNGSQPASDDLDAWGRQGANGGTSPFSSINPADIESVSVLKDADATAIYGARGANGVVLITTKKGASGKPKVDFNIYTGAGKVGRFIPMLNTQEYLALRKEAFANDSQLPEEAPTRPFDLLDWSQTEYTDWQDFFLGGTAKVTNAELAYSGGSATTQYRLSGGFRHDGTVFPGDWRNNRATTRFSLNHRSANNKISFAFTASYGYENSKLPQSDVSNLINLPPNYPKNFTDSAGRLIWYRGFINPISFQQQPHESVTTNTIGNFNFAYRPIASLEFKVNAGYTNIVLDSKSPDPATARNPINNPVSRSYFSDNNVQNWIIEPTANYTLQISEGKLSALLGGSMQQSISQTTSLEARNYSSDALLRSIVGAGLIRSYFPNYAQYNFASAFGRINYDWANKYLVNATFRRDGSSRFGANNRYGNFWAVGAAWIFSEENFVRDNLAFLSFGKLRMSYGLTGNDQIQDYLYLPLYSTVNVPYQNQTGVTIVTAANRNVKWETNKKFEAALELGFLKDRITFTGAYYQNRSGDQLTYISLPTQSGFNSLVDNLPALIQNTGLELLLETKNFIGERFQWTTSFNLTFPRNKLLSFPGLENSFYSSSYVVGEPITARRLFDFTGIDPQTGYPQFATKDGSGIPDFQTDRVTAPVGHPFFGGLNNDFNFKQWSLGFFIQFRQTNGMLNATYFNAIGASMENMNRSVLNRWQQPGDNNTLFPAATATPGSPIANAYGFNFGSSDAFWGNASWLKLQNASLSYSFTKRQISRLGLGGLKVYMQGQNLLTLNKNKYQLDPSTATPGGPPGPGVGFAPAVPPLRTVIFGVNVSF